MTESNWEQSVPRSNYHFDPFKYDAAYDRMRYCGKFEGDWTQELKHAVDASRSITWRTRDPKDNPNGGGNIENVEQDLKDTNAPVDLALTNLEDELANYPTFQRMTEELHLLPGDNRPVQSRLHIQFPGQVWNMHIDKLDKWHHSKPQDVYRFMVMLNDWEAGHFIQYGNHIHTHYRAGEIYSFDWKNVPHCTANAGRGPRCTLLLTGVATEKTLRLFSTYDNKIKV